MKLFFYDMKHQCVHAENDMGELNEQQVALVNSVLKFLKINQIIDDRYKCLALANSIDIVYDDDSQWSLAVH